jgi:hypothetical protein
MSCKHQPQQQQRKGRSSVSPATIWRPTAGKLCTGRTTKAQQRQACWQSLLSQVVTVAGTKCDTAAAAFTTNRSCCSDESIVATMLLQVLRHAHGVHCQN